MFYEKSFEVKQNIPNHPSLAATYNNIGYLDTNLDDYSQAIVIYGKRSTTENLNSAVTCNNADKAYGKAKLGKCQFAQQYLEKAV